MKTIGKHRSKAHAYFDLIWQEKLMTRSQAYHQLGIWMEIKNLNKCHIGLFSRKQCIKLIRILKEKYPSLYEGKEVYLESGLFYS